MIRTIIRIVIFSIIALKSTQYVIGGYYFGSKNSLFLFVIGLSLLFIFLKPLLTFLGMPSKGIGNLFISFILTLILNYVLTIFIPGFTLQPTTISELIIFGFVLPSKRLTAMWANVFSALLLSVIMSFLNWLCENRKK